MPQRMIFQLIILRILRIVQEHIVEVSFGV